MSNSMEKPRGYSFPPIKKLDGSVEKDKIFELSNIIAKARITSQECIKGLEELNINVEERHNVLVPGTPTTPERSMQLLKESIEKSGEVTLYTSVDVCPFICRFCRYNNRTSNNKEALSTMIDDNLNDLNKETDKVSQELLGKKKVEANSLYVGGGTPTLMNVTQMESLFGKINQYYNLKSDAEITMESTPDTVNDEKIALMKRMGVNRVSMGVQRLDDGWLKEMGRKHTSDDVLKALDIFNRNGMRFNVDLIYGFEGQSVESFCKDLLRLLESQPSEVTLYRYENQKRTDDRSIKTVERNQNREDIYAMQEAGRQILQNLGYTEGPDGWFTKPGVDRAKVYDDRWKNQKPMIAFGAEGYSFSADQQHTNKKHVGYHDALKNGGPLLDDDRVYEYLGEQKDLRRMVFDLKSTFQTDFNEEEGALFSGLADKGFGIIENNNHFKLSNKGIIVVEEIMRVLVDKSRKLGEK